MCSGFCPRACPKWAEEEASAFSLLPISLRSVVIVYVSVFLWPSSVFKYLGRLAMTALYFDEEVHNCPTKKPLSYYPHTKDSISSLIAMCNTSCDTRVLYDYWCALKWDDCVQSALLKTPCLTSLLMHRLLMNFADTEIKNWYRPQSRPAIQQPNYFICNWLFIVDIRQINWSHDHKVFRLCWTIRILCSFLHLSTKKSLQL